MLNLILQENKTLRDALELINATAQGLAIVVDAQGRMNGLLTDGDIRRALLAGSTMSTPVNTFMRRNYVSLPVTSLPETIAEHLNERITFIPLLDDAGRPVDYASVSRLHRIPVSEPSLNGNEMLYVMECLKTNWISSQGRFVTQFEKMFSDYHDGRPALAVANGTVALHLAMVALDLKPGDEVIVPNVTFAASANTVIHAGGVPILVDIDENTWTLDIAKTEAAITPRTRAIMPVHLYGHPADMKALQDLARRKNLLLIEDCAEALGAKVNGKRVGTMSQAASFSFFGNKLITTGEGGMIVFEDQAVYERAKRLRDHGMSPERRYWHAEVGYNYRLTNLQAAVGVAQMEQIEHFLSRKKAIAARYASHLSGLTGIRLPTTALWAENVYWLYTIRVAPTLGISRNELLTKMLESGVETRPLFFPLHRMPPYEKFTRGQTYPVSDALSDSGLSLPSAVTLTDAEVDRVAQALVKILQIRELYQTAPR